MIKNIYQKYKELINYLFFGVLTTVVSLVTYYLLVYTILDPNNSIELQIANIISWITCVTFAYITNRIYVFDSKNKNILTEMVKFYSSRLTTLFLDMLFMYIFVTKFNFNDKIIKIIVQIIIIILNYILSKLLVFKTKENHSK